MTKLSPEKIIEGAGGASEQIRRLAKHGYTRTEIARITNKRYQHVRKVLLDAGITTGLDPTRRPRRKVELEAEPIEVTVEARDRRTEPYSAQLLTEAGFYPGGEWQIEATTISIASNAPKETGVYALVMDAEVIYVGVSTNLWRRMIDYRIGHPRQKTSHRVKGLIYQALRDGHRVSVLFSTPGKTTYKGLPVELAPGLEAGLIELIQPPWNVKGNKTV